MKLLLVPLFALVCGAPLTAQTESAFLIKGDTVRMETGGNMVVTGRAEIVTRNTLRFTADQIAYDQGTGLARLTGNVLIRTADGADIPAQELTLNLKDRRIFTLSAGKVSLMGHSPAITPETARIEFSREFPKTDLEVRRANSKP